MKIAFGCYACVGLIFAAFGVVYLLKPEFMPYHAAAVGATWEAAPPGFRILILGLMRVAGGAWLAVAAAMGAMLFVPFRQGARWARWAIPSVGLLAALSSLYGTLLVQLNTQAPAPWMAAALAALLCVAGFFTSSRAASSGP
jgi:hypothetical protein